MQNLIKWLFFPFGRHLSRERSCENVLICLCLGKGPESPGKPVDTLPVVSTWFDDAEVVELNDEQLILYTASPFRKEIIQRR